MNTKKQILKGRRVSKLSATFFGVVLALGACKKEETNIGGSLQDGNLTVLTTDTFTVKTYTELIDSMESDETAISLLGAYHDPVFGAINCGIVTQLIPEGLTQDFPSSAEIVMDSVVIALRYASINQYANFSDISVEVYEIDDVLERDGKDYYTIDSPTTIGPNIAISDPYILSQNTVGTVVVGEDTLSAQLRIHLDPQVGLDLIADSEAGLINANFQTNTFKGVYIKVAVDESMPGFGIPKGSGTVLYFSASDLLSKMTLYYHNASDVAGQFDFDINSDAARYNSISYDREGTNVMAALENTEVGEDVFYVQGSTMRGVVEFPHISEFYKNADGEKAPKIINKAELILPVQDYQVDPFNPAGLLYVFKEIDDNLSSLILDYGLRQGAVYDPENKEYRVRMTREIQAILNGDFENVSYRIFFSGFFGSSIERIIFNGSNTSLKERPRLEITYTEY